MERTGGLFAALLSSPYGFHSARNWWMAFFWLCPRYVLRPLIVLSMQARRSELVTHIGVGNAAHRREGLLFRDACAVSRLATG